MLYIKLHSTDGGTMLAMCDSDMINSIIEDGEVYINVRDYSDFYKGKLVDAKGAKSIISKSEIRSASVIGKESVRVAVEKGIVERSNVKTASGIAYANAYRIE